MTQQQTYINYIVNSQQILYIQLFAKRQTNLSMFNLLLQKDSTISADLERRKINKQTNANHKASQQMCQIVIKQSLNKIKQWKRQDRLQSRQFLKKKVREISQGKSIQNSNLNSKNKRTTYKSLGIYKIVQQLQKICHDIKHTITLMSGVYTSVLIEWGKTLKEIEKKTSNCYQSRLQKMSEAVSIAIDDRNKEEESGSKKLTESEPTFTFANKTKLKTKYTFKDQLPATISDKQEEDIKITNINDRENRSQSNHSRDQKQQIINKKVITQQESFQRKDSSIEQKLQDELKTINQMLCRLQKVII